MTKFSVGVASFHTHVHDHPMLRVFPNDAIATSSALFLVGPTQMSTWIISGATQITSCLFVLLPTFVKRYCN